MLIYSRIILGLAIGVIAYFNIPYSHYWIVGLMFLGLLTDVFDGVIARKLNVATEKLRLWDSNVDQFFWTMVILSIFHLNLKFLLDNVFLISIVVILQAINYLISYVRFKKSIATHSILAKIWTLSLLIFLTDVCLNHSSNWPFLICIVLGIISRLEIALIIIRLKKWTTDVPSVFLVNKINRGDSFKKISLFN